VTLSRLNEHWTEPPLSEAIMGRANLRVIGDLSEFVRQALRSGMSTRRKHPLLTCLIMAKDGASGCKLAVANLQVRSGY
jgi:hypothetical protein